MDTPERLLHYGRDVGHGSLIRPIWKAVSAHDAIDLFLRSLLDLRIHDHSEDEGLNRRHVLRALASGAMNVKV